MRAYKTAAVAAAAIFTLGACATSTDSGESQPAGGAEKTSSAEPSSGWQDSDEAQDLESATLSCKTQYTIQTCYAIFKVKNNSSGISDYSIGFNVENKSGSRQYESSVAFVMGLQPGQVTTEKSMLGGKIPDPETAQVVVTMADRTEA